MARFKFTGTIGVADNYAKTDKCSDKKTNYKRISLSVIQAKNNRAFCEFFATEQKTIKTKDVDNNDIEISAEDAQDETVLKKVAGYRKHVIDLGDDNRHEFAYDYAFAEFLEEHKDDIKDKKFMITGTINKNYYNESFSDRFVIQNMYAVDDDAKCKLLIELDECWTAEDLDYADFATDHKVYLNGKTSTFLDKKTLNAEKGSNVYVDQQLVLDASKLDFENENHMELLDFKLYQLGLKRDGEKITSKLKKNKIYTIGITCAYVNGQEKIEFDEESLTPNQKMSIKLGLSKTADFAPNGDAYGQKVVEYKIYSYDVTKPEAADGCYDTGMTMDEYEENFFHVSTSEKLDEVVEEAVKKAPATTSDDLDDLFG